MTKEIQKRNVPFVDLYPQYLELKNEIDFVISDVIKNSNFIRGSYVEKFEEMFASLLGIKKCISCANGTDALYIAMKALDIKNGDEVIVPSHSWISTSETVTQCGAKVVFCDTDNLSFTIDANKIEEKISKKTVGIIPVHLYGQSADMDKIMKIAKKYNLWVIEDCAQAHLATFNKQLVGTFGNVATFSFYPGKNLGAFGDAGAIVTNDTNLALKIELFARHGGKGKHLIEGVNSRMDSIQAAILSTKIPKLKIWNKKRNENAQIYLSNLSNFKNIKLPYVFENRSHVWHLFVIETLKRDELFLKLKKRNIGVAINYPIALPFLPAYKYLNHKPEDFPNAYSAQQQIISLPMYPHLTEEDIAYVCNSIKEIMLS